MSTSSTAADVRHKVLLVDDDAVSLELMAVLLAHEGHQVLRANDAGAALAILTGDRTAPPDVMLVDLQMPGVSGGQLAERIQALGIPKPLLLAMSATEVQPRPLPIFDGFLLKPLAVDQLREALNPNTRGVRMKRPAAVSTGKQKPGQTLRQTLDAAVVRKLLVMMPVEALHETVTACIADCRTSIETIRHSLGNIARIRHYAHRIKGAAAMIGATRLAGIAGELEVGGDKGAATLNAFEDLTNACDELERMLFAGKFTNTQGPHDNHYDRTDT